MSGKTIKEKKDHLTYILEKEKKTLSYFEAAVKGNGLFSDIEKPVLISSEKDPNTTPVKSTTKKHSKNKKMFDYSKKNKRFPKGRLE